MKLQEVKNKGKKISILFFVIALSTYNLSMAMNDPIYQHVPIYLNQDLIEASSFGDTNKVKHFIMFMFGADEDTALMLAVILSGDILELFKAAGSK